MNLLDHRKTCRTILRGLRSLLLPAIAAASFLAIGAGELFAAGGDVIWQSQDSQAGKQEARRSVVDSSGNVIVTGYRNLNGDTDNDFWTVKFKSDGSGVAWRAHFDKIGGSDQANAIAVDKDDNIIVTGRVLDGTTGTNNNMHTIKYNGANGTVIWQHTYDGAAGGIDSGMAVTTDENGDVFVAGYTQNSQGNLDYIILRYPKDGRIDNSNTPNWTAIYGHPNGDDIAESIAARNGKVAVTGRSWNGSDYDILTIRYDIAAETSWQKRYATSAQGGSKDDMGEQVLFDPLGNVVVTGVTVNNLDKDIYTAKYSATTGDVIWEQVFNGAFDDEPTGLAVDASGVYVTGYTWTLNAKHDFYTAKYVDPADPQVKTPVIAWEKNFNSYNGNDDIASATGIVVDESGDLFVTGYTISNNNNDSYQTVKYRKSDGTELWQVGMDVSSGRNDRTIGIGIDPAGNVLVAGWTDSAVTGLDYHVVKYDPDLINPPTNLKATLTSNSSVTLSWDYLHSVETGFIIQRCTGWGCTNFADLPIDPLPVGSTSYTDSTITADAFYYYRVRAFNANNSSHFSNTTRTIAQYINFIPNTTPYIFDSTYNGDDFAKVIAVGPDNNPVVTGYSDSKEMIEGVPGSGGGLDYLTMKFDRSLSQLWNDRYDSAQNGLDVPTCLFINQNNDVLVSGHSELFLAQAGGNINSIFTIKYPSTGEDFAWEDQFNGPGGIDDRATAISSSADANNNIAVVGYGRNSRNNQDIYLIKYLANGTRAWIPVIIDKLGDDIPSAVVFDKNGDIFITGTSHNGSNFDIYTAKYNGATGAQIWEDLYNGGYGDDQGLALAIDPAGNPYVSGFVTTASNGRDFYTIKYDGANVAPKRRLWGNPYDGPAHGNDWAAAISVDPIDGSSVTVAGTRTTRNNDDDFHVIRYNANGDEVWSKTILRPDTDEELKSMSTDLSGNIFVAGSTTDWTNTSALAFRIKSDGTILDGTAIPSIEEWTTDPNTEGYMAEASSVAVNRLGEAFMAGYSENESLNADYLVFKMSGATLQPPYPVTTATTNASVTLTWSDNSLAEDGYRIYRKAEACSSATLSFSLLASPLANQVTYTDSTVTPTNSYCYRVTAYAGETETKYVQTDTQPLAPAPLTLTAVSATQINLSWTNVFGETGYTIERKVGAAGSWTVLTSKAADVTTHSDTGLTGGTVYYYRIKASNAVGDSPYIEQSLPSVPVMSAPVVVSSSQINLAWTDLATETAYILERKTGTGGTWSQVGSNLAQNSITYNDTGLYSGTLFYYRLKGRNASGDSAYSAEVSATTLLQAPTLNTATGTNTTTVALGWTDTNNSPNGNESNYQASYAACTNTDPVSCADVNGAYWGGWTNVTAFATNSVSGNVTSLIPGRSYKFRMQGLLTGANSTFSSPERTATTVLPTPAAPTTSNISNNSVTLTWTDILGETNYDIIKDGVRLNLALAKDTITYTVTGLSPATAYNFQVYAYNGLSSSTSTATPATTTVNPTSLSSVVPQSATAIQLTWADATGESGYEIQRRTLNNQEESPASPPTGWTAWTTLTTTPMPLAPDTVTYLDGTPALTAGNTYQYRVRYKIGTSAYSAYSNEIYATTTPRTPATMTVTAGVINWENVPGEAGYYLYQKQLAGADCATEDWSAVTPSTIAATTYSYTPSGLTAGATYCYQVKAFNNAGVSAPRVITYLQAPTNITASGATQTTVNVSWPAVAGATSYTLQWSTASTFTSPGSFSGNVTSRTVPGLIGGTTYFFRVQAVWGNGNSIWTSAIPSALTIPTTPGTPTATPASTTSVTISWSSSYGATGYRYQYKPRVAASCSAEDWTGITENPLAGVTVTIGSLTTGSAYCFRARSYNASGDSPYSTTPATQTTLLATPTLNPLSGITAGNICLSWNNVAANEGYRIERSLDNTTWPTTFSTLKDVASYCDTSVLAGTVYYYRVSPKNIVNGYSTASNVQSTTTTPAAPVALTATAISNTRVDLTWNASLNATKYRLERKEGSGNWELVIEQSGTSYQNTGLKAGTTYFYRVLAWNTSGLYSTPSSEATVITLTLGNVAISSLTPANPTSVTVVWTYDGSVCIPSGCALPEGYEIETKLASGRWANIATITKGDETSYIDRSGLRPGKTYYYRVRSYRGTERSPYSAEQSVTTLPYAKTTCSYGPNEASHAPVITSTPQTSASQGTAYNYQMTISDPFSGDSFYYTLLTAPSGMTVSTTGLVSWTPTSAQLGAKNVLIRVSDIVGNSVEQSMIITVTAN
ncbi:fibronectin type III domain-containing protein [Geobacter pelophilus]|uniref:Fibronectin type III domain-containing protein n=1 Tax=Geoanaerobacter pelophilus TaxID=60036 RepID=A0AAW4L5L1_9BACT|nr:fibronectin type III domain-containing protein [Geoanaerobacter pelophilus]MBT0663850.1 fibronectin type III domain-containing protein [Geoanaerobacter pelophilus]